jgi:hypothetical protein
MSDESYGALFHRIHEQYRRENWFGPDGMAIHPRFRRKKVWESEQEDIAARHYWYDEYGQEFLFRKYDCYDSQQQREFVLEENIPVPRIEYPPATEGQLRATEEALGFPLPPLLRALYAQVANGGVGPRYGIMGAIGGFEDVGGTIVDAYLSKKERYRFVELTTCEQQAEPYLGPGYLHRNKLVSNLYFDLPSDVWPDRLLQFYDQGCGDYSCIDVNTNRIFLVASDERVLYEANSLEEWLERWLQDDMYAYDPGLDDLSNEL